MHRHIGPHQKSFMPGGIGNPPVTDCIFSCTVASTRSVTPLIREIVLALPAGADFYFRAGNFVQVTAPAYRRAYRDFVQPETFRAESTWADLGRPTITIEDFARKA